jgi:basic membrane protein A
MNTWFDPPAEAALAQTAVDSGIDVFISDMSSPAIGSIAEREGAYWLPYDQDRSTEMPNAWAGGFRVRWGAYYRNLVERILAGTWEPELYYGGLSDGMLEQAPFGTAVTPEMQAEIEEVKQGIIDGSFDVLAGPMTDNEGNVQIAEGETLDVVARQACCDWLAEGIVGELPS